MKENFEIEFDNLTEEDKEKFLEIVEKAKTPIKKREKLKNYYFICNGEICYKNTLDTTNEIHYIMGNYFQTKEEAEFAMKKQIIYQQLSNYALAYNTEKFDWTNPNQFKWFIRYDNKYKRIIYTWTRYSIDLNQIYFTSEEIARATVEKVGEDNIKKYLFGVEE